MAELLAANPGRRGLITANGGYLTKHSFGVYGTEPPSEFRWEDMQPAVDREPTGDGLVEWEGIGTVEAWTTPVNRDGQPEKAFLARTMLWTPASTMFARRCATQCCKS